MHAGLTYVAVLFYYLYLTTIALLLVVLKSYFVIFSTIKYKIMLKFVELKLNNLISQPQCYVLKILFYSYVHDAMY